ncbi:MAG: hypothetical protein QM698_15925 [Micropepsaceae bacterium]
MSDISTVDALEACIGAAGLPVKMKVIDHIDAQAAGWLRDSPLSFVAFARAGGPVATLAGGAAGFATAKDKATLSLPLNALDDAPGAVGEGVATLFLIPGIGETLRVNGRVSAVTGAAVEIAVEECFVHCAKALIRSDFWAAAPAEAPDDPAAFLEAARFLALATSDAAGGADMSPKGDPAGGLVRLQNGAATLAERPGNRLAYGFHNMIAQPQTAAVVIVPGATTVALVAGKAAISNDEAARAAFVVEGKTPILVTRIEGAEIVLRESRALAAAKLWPLADHAVSQVDPSAVLVAHVKANKSKGLAAMALRTAVNRGTVAKGLAHSYRENLY